MVGLEICFTSTFLAVQWLELCAFMAEGVDLKKKETGVAVVKGVGSECPRQ